MAGRRRRSVTRARRRALVIALALASVVVFYLRGHEPIRASARGSAPALSPSPVASAASPSPSASSTPKPKAKPKASASASRSPSPSPSPTPDGPPFVLDAAPSCAGNTALIDIQVAATSKRPITKLELLLDGAPAPLTPAPSYPLTQFAGRSSGAAAPAGQGQWVLRATDPKGIVEVQPFPYACG